MPIHDWTRVDAGIFHHFHQRWIGAICDELNEHLLPEDYYALGEQWAGGRNPDVLTLRGREHRGRPASANGHGPAAAVQERPKTTFVVESEPLAYVRKKVRAVVRHVSDDRIIALAEVLSPGNKSSIGAFDQFKTKVVELLQAEVNVLLIDLLPRTRRDPRGVHAEVWEAVTGDRPSIPRKPPLTLASYETGDVVRGYFEPVGVGDPLPDMPLFLEYGWHVRVPLEKTYAAAFRTVPARWRRVIEGRGR
jgi:hypothetical protein